MNLVKIAQYVRTGIVIFISILLFYVAFSLTVPIAKSLYQSVFPPESPPNPIYGKLDTPEFVKKQILGFEQVYKLNTRTGKLPTSLPHKLTVYKYKTAPFSYNAGKEAQKHARKLGFSDRDLITDLKGKIYKWRDPTTGALLEILIDSKELTLKTALIGKSSRFPPKSMSKSSAINSAKSVLLNIDRLSEHYKKGKQTVYLGKFAGRSIVEVDSRFEVQIARVDFFRFIYNMPIYGPDPKEGLLQVYIKAAEKSGETPNNNPIVKAYLWNIEKLSNATYPLIDTQYAWNAILSGQGTIASVIPKDSSPLMEYRPVRVSEILINDVYVAYYDSLTPQKYMQPIYVFEGNYIANDGGLGEITIYYPAISKAYLKEATPEENENTP